MKNENIARVLKYYRTFNNLSINDIRTFLRKHNYVVSEKTIYSWEIGTTQPRADVLMLLCEYYKIDDILTTFGYRDAEDSLLKEPLSISEISLIKSYREHKDMQPAIHKLLDIPSPTVKSNKKNNK